MKSCIAVVALVWLMPSVSFAQIVQQRATLKAFPVDSILGKWVRYSTEFETMKRVSKNTVSKESSEVRCNACPEIDFKADSTATFKLKGTSQSATNAFLWSVKGRNLVVHNLKGENKTSLLSDGQYRIDTRAGDNSGSSRELILVSAKGTRHILTRSYD
jgi:hypothetical protein